MGQFVEPAANKNTSFEVGCLSQTSQAALEPPWSAAGVWRGALPQASCADRSRPERKSTGAQRCVNSFEQDNSAKASHTAPRAASVPSNVRRPATPGNAVCVSSPAIFAADGALLIAVDR